MKHFYDDDTFRNSWVGKLLIGLAAALSVVILILLVIEFATTNILNLNIVLISLAAVSFSLIIGFALYILYKLLKNQI